MYLSTPNKLWRQWIAMVMVVVFVVSGCSSLHMVAITAEDIGRDVVSGDNVVVQTHDGTQHEFKVARVSENALLGDDVAINFSDMAKLQVKKNDTTKTVLLVLGIVAVAVATGSSGGDRWDPGY